MSTSLRGRLNLIFDKRRLEDFFYGPFYPAYVSLIVTLFFSIKLELVGLLLISITASIIFLRFKDATPIIPLLFFVVLVFRDYSVMNNVWAYIFLAPAIISFVIKFFIYRIKNFKPGKLFFPLIIVCYALFSGGLFSPVSSYTLGVPIMVTIGPTMLIIYLFFSAYVCPPNNFDIKKYLAYLLVLMGLTTFLHLSIYHIHVDIIKDDCFEPYFLGWGNINCAATLLLLSIPSCWYLITKTTKIIPCFVILLLLYVAVFFSNSAGVTVISVIFTPILAFFSYKNIPTCHRACFTKSLLILFSTVAIAIAITIGFYGFSNIITTLKTFFSESSRSKLYLEALDLFSQYPLFGVGLGYTNVENLDTTSIMLYNFHSVFFHVLATMGIMGIVAYIFYYIARFKILMETNTCFSLFITITFIMFECYAFIDTAEFNAIPLMSTLTVMITIVELTNKKSNDQALPLIASYKI